MKLSKTGFLSIDLLRAIASLGVFYYHLHMGNLLANYSHINWLNATDVFGAHYAVPLFFLISGFCIHLSNLQYIRRQQVPSLKAYFKRRFLRIYPPYLIAVFFSIFVNMLTRYQSPLTISDAVVHLFLLQSFTIKYFSSLNVVLWTIAVEISLYILYPIFYFIRLRFGLNRALLISFLVSACSMVYYYCNYKGNISNRQCFNPLNLWFAWCSGAYIADKVLLDNSFFKNFRSCFFYLIIVSAFLLVKVFYRPELIIMYYQLTILIWTAPLILFVTNEAWLLKFNSLLIKTLGYIGLSSYSLYLFHEPLIALKNYLSHAFLPPSLQPFGIVTGILIIPVIAWFSYRYFEVPFMIKKRNSAADA